MIAFDDRRLVQRKGENVHEEPSYHLAVAITNKEDCEKAGKVWDNAWQEVR